VVSGAVACNPSATTPVAKAASFGTKKVRSFTDTLAVTSVADSSANLWVGSNRGLLRWDLATGKYALLTTKDGLPDNRIAATAVDGTGQVWAATAKGVGRATPRGAWEKFPPAPVGEFLTGLIPSGDGKTVWAGGPEGLARLTNGAWERYLPDVPVTVLTIGDGGSLWIGTSGKGVLRVPPAGDKLEAYGLLQGCEIDNVRGVARFGTSVIVVGDSAGGSRVAVWDPATNRFFTYTVDIAGGKAGPVTLGWAARANGITLLSANEQIFQISLGSGDPPLEPGRLRLTPRPVTVAIGPRSLGWKAEMNAAALDAAPVPPQKPLVNAKGKPVLPPAPRLDTSDSTVRLPDGVTVIASSERGLLIGTRFLGAARIENGVERRFRMSDLAAGADRLTVACDEANDCYLATGGPRAWRFDGQSFVEAKVDPEPGSRVLAMIPDPHNQVLAIHRGAKDSELRISTVANGNWTPVTIQPVHVPHGVPELNFAVFASTGKLWVGLRYIDKDKDAVDFGAAEIGLESGEVKYHRQGLPAKPDHIELPNDTVAMWWRSNTEAWFATRSGAARLIDGKIKVFTENDGMESELIHDIGPGAGSEVWVATMKGTGRYDGTRWTYPKMGPYYLPATSLAHDGKHVFLGTDKGVYCVGECEPEPVDTRRGLIDSSVVGLRVDTRGRVWVLTAKGISIIDN